MLDFNSIMLGSSNPKPLIEFYTKVFDRIPDMSDSDWAGWQIGKCFINIGAHSEVKGASKEPQRLLINLETAEIEEEYKRIKEVEGVKVVKELYEMEGYSGMWIATFADPDGNYFQLMTPWEEQDTSN